MEKSDKRYGVQMSLFDKAGWTKDVPVLHGIAVNYADQGQVGEYSTGAKEKRPLATNMLEKVIALPNM